MLEHGCDTVILAITEFDLDFWFPNLNAIVQKGAPVRPAGLGRHLGHRQILWGEQVSLFLQNNIHHRQVSAYTGRCPPPASTRMPSAIILPACA